MRGAPGTRVLLMLAVLVCGVAFTPLVEGYAWLLRPFVLAIVVSLGMAVAAAIARRRGWPILTGAILAVLATTALFVPGTGILGLVPTPASVGSIARLIADGSESIATQTIPAEPVPGIVLLLALGLLGLVFAIEMLVFVAGAPALVGIPLLVVSAVPNLIDPSTVQLLVFVALAAVYVAVLLTRRPGSRPVSAIAAAAAVIASLAVAAVLPPVIPSDAPPLGNVGVTIGLNPEVTVRDNLVRPNPVTAFTYTSSTNSPSYFTLTVLDDFDGPEWEPGDFVRGGDVRRIGPDAARAPGARVTDVEAEVTMGQISGRLLPVPWAPTSVTGLDGDWSWESDTLAVRTDTSSIRGQRYTVDGEIATPTEEQLTAAGTDSGVGTRQFLTLPRNTPSIITDIAKQVTEGDTTFYEMAEDLQSYFQGPDFTYSTEAPVEQGYDGSNVDVIARFLQVKSGYCVHFSSAMALMARSLGIPARLGVGFTGGQLEFDPTTNKNHFVVTTNNLHAWPELYFAGVGWVRFEPTPGIGTVPQFPRTSSSEPTGSPTSSAPTSAAPTSGPSASRPADDPGATDPGSSAGMSTQSVRDIVLASLLALVLLVIVLGPMLLRLARRVRRHRAIVAGDELAAWNEVRDTALDLGIPVLETESARALATSLASRAGEDAEAPLARILSAVEQGAYARSQHGDVAVDDVTAVRRALLRSAGVRERIRAVVLPRSLLRRH